ncbi:hypothetical protein N6H14_09740 [Paenibacillus sp. CC-CFT747]|nr:hypothetical protein N6H14_09740 [Paenibacillus sp. CC-CFT747]
MTFGFFSLDLLGKLSDSLDWMRALSPSPSTAPGKSSTGRWR